MEWGKNDAVTITYRDIRVYETEREIPVFSTVSRAAFATDVVTKLGWTHVQDIVTDHITAMHFTPPRGVDQDVLDALRQLESILDVEFKNDVWVVMWIEKSERSKSLRTLKRQRPELFTPSVRSSASKSRFRPHEKRRQFSWDDLYSLVRFR